MDDTSIEAFYNLTTAYSFYNNIISWGNANTNGIFDSELACRHFNSLLTNDVQASLTAIAGTLPFQQTIAGTISSQCANSESIENELNTATSYLIAPITTATESAFKPFLKSLIDILSNTSDDLFCLDFGTLLTDNPIAYASTSNIYYGFTTLQSMLDDITSACGGSDSSTINAKVSTALSFSTTLYNTDNDMMIQYINFPP